MSSSNSTSTDSNDTYERLAIAGLVIVPLLIIILVYSPCSLALLYVIITRRKRSAVQPAPLKRKCESSANMMIINEDSLAIYAKTNTSQAPAAPPTFRPETSMLSEVEHAQS